MFVRGKKVRECHKFKVIWRSLSNIKEMKEEEENKSQGLDFEKNGKQLKAAEEFCAIN